MRIAVIEQGHRQYLMDTFAQHSEFPVEIACFVEQNPKVQTYQSIRVIPLSELKGSGCEAVLVAVSHNHHLSRLLTWLHDEKIEDIYVIRLFALDTHADFIMGTSFDTACVDKMPGLDEKPYLVHLESHVCDHCNLNCKVCNNFSPFVTERRVADTVQFERDLQQLAGLFSNIGRFFLLGGEPLLEPEHCCQMIRIVRRYFPGTELRLLTNALLISKMDPEFWDCLRENNVIVHISVYPPVVNQLVKIEAILQSQNVKYLLARKVEKFVKRLTLFPFEDAEFNNDRCGSAGCHYLRSGILAKCPDGLLVGNMASALDCSCGSLQDGSVIDIAGQDDPWDVIHRLDSPCDLCKRCSCRRLEAITWEPVNSFPDPADWLIENRLEYEKQVLSEQLRGEVEKRESTEVKLKDASHIAAKREEELRRAEQRVKELSESLRKKELALSTAEQNICELKQTIASREDEMQKAQQELRNWHTKFDQINGKFRNKERQFNEVNGELNAVQSSLSFRLGRALTWLPRKFRGGARCLKEHGLKYTLKLFLEKVAEKILPESFIKLNRAFQNAVLAGYHIYSDLILRYGDDVTILRCAPFGTGDYYFCGMYLNAWLKKHGVTNYVFITMLGAQKAVTELFSVYKSHTVPLDGMLLRNMRSFYGFVGPNGSNYFFLDHQITAPMSITFPLMGYRNLTILDFYLYYGLGLGRDSYEDMPEFEKDPTKINAWFYQYNLVPGETIMLSPYSASNEGYLPPEEFWENLAGQLIELGYYVCTNCAGAEKPIRGTTGLCIPYKEIVPFLDCAGAFIGVRSGLCDIIATSKCKKLVIHTYRNRFWPDGNSIAYTGLVNMGLCDDAVEMEYEEGREENILEQIMETIIE